MDSICHNSDMLSGRRRNLPFTDIAKIRVHPAFHVSGSAVFPAARQSRPGWEARWGAEEVARVSGVPIVATTTSNVGGSTAAVPTDVHPAYAGVWNGRATAVFVFVLTLVAC